MVCLNSKAWCECHLTHVQVCGLGGVCEGRQGEGKVPGIPKCHLSVELCLPPPDLLTELIARASFYSEFHFPLSTCFLMVVLEPPASELPVVLVKCELWGSAVQRVSGVG